MSNMGKYCYEHFQDFAKFCSRIFMVWGLTLKSLIHFEFIPVCGVRRWSSFIFMHVSVQFSQHHLLNKLSLAHCMCLFFCQILIYYKGVGLFLGSVFCSIDLCVCFNASTMLFWLLWPYSIVWYKVVWFLQLCSFSGLLLLCGAFCDSM